MLATSLSIGIPTFTVLVGILLSRSDNNNLRSELRSEISSVRGEIRGLELSLRAEIASVEQSLRAEIASLEQSLRAEIASVAQSLRAEIAASREQAHDDTMILVGISREHEGRITRLEARS